MIIYLRLNFICENNTCRYSTLLKIVVIIFQVSQRYFESTFYRQYFLLFINDRIWKKFINRRIFHPLLPANNNVVIFNIVTIEGFLEKQQMSLFGKIKLAGLWGCVCVGTVLQKPQQSHVSFDKISFVNDNCCFCIAFCCALTLSQAKLMTKWVFWKGKTPKKMLQYH